MEPMHLREDSPVFQCDHMLALSQRVRSRRDITTYWEDRCLPVPEVHPVRPRLFR